MTDIIWLVWASRGEYSDREEYAVCWYATEAEATRAAEEMQRRSDAVGRVYARTVDDHRAIAQGIGDPRWSGFDRTVYSAEPLERGKEAP